MAIRPRCCATTLYEFMLSHRREDQGAEKISQNLFKSLRALW